MKNKKLVSLSGLIIMIAFSIFAVFRSFDSGNNWKIIASFLALAGFSSMYLFFRNRIVSRN